MPRSVTLTRRELDIMSVLWKLGDATVGELRENLSDNLAYPTVQTMRRVLEAKKLVKHKLDGRAFRFYPLSGPHDAGHAALKRLAPGGDQGPPDPLVSRLVHAAESSAGE